MQICRIYRTFLGNWTIVWFICWKAIVKTIYP